MAKKPIYIRKIPNNENEKDLQSPSEPKKQETPLKSYIIIRTIAPDLTEETKLIPVKNIAQISSASQLKNESENNLNYTKNAKLTRNSVLLKVIQKENTEMELKKEIEDIEIKDENVYTEEIKKEADENEKEKVSLYKKLNDRYTCDICQASFEQKNKMLRHLRGKHSFHRPFQCSTCSKAFKYKCDLKAHRLVHQDIDSSLLHCCDKCDYRSKTKNNLKSHYIRKHTNDYKFSCEHCGKQFKMEWDLKFHIGTHGTSQHMCDICGKFYTSDYSLYKHRKVTHINEYKFQCAICNKRLLTKENLDNHMLQHNKTYECKECGKNFSSKRYLATHVTTHSEIKPFNCHVCDKTFRTSYMRNTHLYTHTAERPHICDLCGHAFKRRYYMIEHRKKHPDAHLTSPPIPLGGHSCPKFTDSS